MSERPQAKPVSAPTRCGNGRTFDEIDGFARALPAVGRLIGVDLGARTLGLALSDVTRMIASPLETIRRGKFAADSARLLALADTHGAGGLVVGLPISLDGTEGPRAQSARAYARNLNRASPLPILLWDERLSTVAAERILIEADVSRRKRALAIDKLAATVILQNALDRMTALSRTVNG